MDLGAGEITEEQDTAFYEEINHENGTCFRCSICRLTLSRKQLVESHLASIHGKGEKYREKAYILLRLKLNLKRLFKFLEIELVQLSYHLKYSTFSFNSGIPQKKV